MSPSIPSTLLALLAVAATSSRALPTLATRASSSTTPQNLCGTPDDYAIIANTPYIVYNMMYNAADIVGRSCTGFTGLTINSNGGAPTCGWNSTWDIAKVASTSNIPKGYSFVGLTQGLENRIGGIASIPASSSWVRTNETAYKGNDPIHVDEVYHLVSALLHTSPGPLRQIREDETLTFLI